MTFFNDIPLEIQDYIFNIHYKDVFKNNVIKELNDIKSRIDEIQRYLIHHGVFNITQGPLNKTVSHHIFYFKNQNDFLKKLWKKRIGIYIMCNHTNKKVTTLNLYMWSNMFA